MDAVSNVLKNVPGVDPRPNQRMQAFSGMNDGPVSVATADWTAC